MITRANFFEKLFGANQDDEVPIDPVTGDKIISWDPKYKDALEKIELPFHPSLFNGTFIEGMRQALAHYGAALRKHLACGKRDTSKCRNYSLSFDVLQLSRVRLRVLCLWDCR